MSYFYTRKHPIEIEKHRDILTGAFLFRGIWGMVDSKDSGLM
jgi:hypothetical protein